MFTRMTFNVLLFQNKHCVGIEKTQVIWHVDRDGNRSWLIDGRQKLVHEDWSFVNRLGGFCHVVVGIDIIVDHVVF